MTSIVAVSHHHDIRLFHTSGPREQPRSHPLYEYRASPWVSCTTQLAVSSSLHNLSPQSRLSFSNLQDCPCPRPSFFSLADSQMSNSVTAMPPTLSLVLLSAVIPLCLVAHLDLQSLLFTGSPPANLACASLLLLPLLPLGEFLKHRLCSSSHEDVTQVCLALSLSFAALSRQFLTLAPGHDLLSFLL